MAGKENLIVWIFFSIFSWIFFASLNLAASSSDTLKQGDILDSSSSTFLVSAGKVFTLGFFRPADLESDSNDSYLGIWYTGTSAQPLWVANRNNPVINNSGVLTIDSSGKLIITHDGGKIIELYGGSQTGTTGTTAATLLDSGNFVLRELNNNNVSLWESFDYPTDTLLPGMKLGVNHRTGRKWLLTSWFSQTMPAPGAFTLEWDPSGRKLIVRRRGVIYWTSGVLGDKDDFEYINKTDADRSKFNYKFTNVTTKDEEYFNYSLVKDSVLTPEFWMVSPGWLLNFQGQIVDGDRGIIANVNDCYGDNIEFGCQQWEQPKCRNQYQRFVNRSGGFVNRLGENPIIAESRLYNNKSIGWSDCREICWNDCECIGFKGDFAPGCLFWRGPIQKFVFEQDVSGQTVAFFSLNVSQPIEPGRNSEKEWIWIITAVVVTFAMVVFGLLCYLRSRKIRLRGDKDLITLIATKGNLGTDELNNDENKGKDLKVFSFEEIVAATNSFSPENKLGQGGFGPVYKGILIDGEQIAVKRLSKSGRSGQGFVEFKNELTLIARLQHVNLVRLIGYCIQGDEKMLIYEYMPNKSLDTFLFDPIQREKFTWEKRFHIIQGIAQGLLYLHKYSRLNIIHRDLKAGNILLDESMKPKISDFGMARIFKKNVLEVHTERRAGTYGYMAPEYAMGGIFSIKSDVFSFGVMILEIVSGRKNNGFYGLDSPLNLVSYTWELWNNNATLELIDPMLRGSCSSQQLQRCIHVGLLCVEEHAVDRPTMSNVISMLNNESVNLSMPRKPAFVPGRSDVAREDLNKREAEKCSTNELSFTALDGR